MVKRAALVSLLAVMLGVLLLPAARPASAHTDIIFSDPADGASLDAAPRMVVLTFNEELLPDAVDISVTDSSGALVPVELPAVDGSNVVLPWPSGTAGGAHSLNYRVVSQDGHPVTGSITFTIAGTASSALPTEATDEASPVPSASTAPPTDQGESGSAAGWWIAGVGVLLIAGVALVYARHDRQGA